MKQLFFRLLIVLIVPLQMVCCRDFTPDRYVLALPEAPQPWVSLLGEPHWRLEWMGTDGQRQIADILPEQTSNRGFVEIELPVTWANPVMAWPYWPEHSLYPGLFMPAGALFPFDTVKELLNLSWKAGVNAAFYKELAVAASSNANGNNETRIPANFDWPRFQELFETEGTLNEFVQKDPWLVDWQSVAERTIASGFDRRRLVPQAVSSMAIPVHGGPWFGASPFADPLEFPQSETPVFPVRSGINVWISAKGILRYTKNEGSGQAWVFMPWE